MSVPVIYNEEAAYWRYVPRIQAAEDFEKTAPPSIVHSGPIVGWLPCYEYRPSTADKFIFAVEFPAGMLIAPYGASACNPALLRPILQKLKSRMRLKTRIVLLDCLLLLGIVVQWWLVGLWIDHLREQHRSARRWIIPAAAITIAGIAGGASAFLRWTSLELSAAILMMIASLAWVVLLLMFGVAALRWVVRSSLKTRAIGYN
jgi:hypothetical protein